MIYALAPLVAPVPLVTASPAALVQPAQEEDLQLLWYDIRSIPTATEMDGEGVIMGLPITMSAIDALELLGVSGYEAVIEGAVQKWLPGPARRRPK